MTHSLINELANAFTTSYRSSYFFASFLLSLEKLRGEQARGGATSKNKQTTTTGCVDDLMTYLLAHTNTDTHTFK
jgi:hypothetical protein